MDKEGPSAAKSEAEDVKTRDKRKELILYIILLTALFLSSVACTYFITYKFFIDILAIIKFFPLYFFKNSWSL